MATDESRSCAVKWIKSIERDILAEALDDRAYLRDRVKDYNSRVAAAINKIENVYLKFSETEETE